MAERNEHVSVRHTPRGTLVTCSIWEQGMSVRWSVKCYVTRIADGVHEARAGATKALEDLMEVLTS